MNSRTGYKLAGLCLANIPQLAIPFYFSSLVGRTFGLYAWRRLLHSALCMRTYKHERVIVLLGFQALKKSRYLSVFWLFHESSYTSVMDLFNFYYFSCLVGRTFELYTWRRLLHSALCMRTYKHERVNVLVGFQALKK
jgi:hypothetical protein